jgi:protease II
MLKGDTREWRDIGHARWHDPYAAYEDPSSAEFKAAVKAEQSEFAAALKPFAARCAAAERQFEANYAAALPCEPAAAQEVTLWRGHTVYIQHAPGHRLHVWIFDAGKQVRAFQDLESFGTDPDSPYYYTIRDVGNGDQTLELSVYEIGVHSPQYKIKDAGPNAAFAGEHLYFTTTENMLRSSAFYRVNKHNGRYRSKLYEEYDKRFNVVLLQPPRQSNVFIRTENALSQRLGVVEKGELKWFTPVPPSNGSGQTLAPIAAGIYATNTALEVEGRTYKYPGHSFYNDAAILHEGAILVSTVKKGVNSLFLFDVHDGIYKQLYIGKELNEIDLHSHSTMPSFTLRCYYKPEAVYEIQGGTVVCVRTLPEPVKIVRHSTGFARAADGTMIPYSFVSAVKRPKKLIVAGYGAYGLTSLRSYPIRWLTWLQHGYAFVEAVPRGGRDDGDAWYDAARTAARKHTTLEDVAAVIKTVQARYKFRKENTIVYGRSAGGWPAAYIGLKYHDRVGAVYAEVPYLDVLRTTTNPALPLTQLEYDEFGDPAGRPEEYEALQNISPMDIAGVAPGPAAPFFLLRTALHDSQVLPYESLKFAAKLRGLGWRVVTGVDGDSGHFAKIKNMNTFLAEDYVLLDAATARGAEGLKTRRQHARLRSHSSRGTRRRRTSSRKH